MTDPAEREHATAMGDLQTAFAHAKAALSRMNDPHRVFELAAEDVEVLRELAEGFGTERALAVERIWEANATSLAGLAALVGISKPRADQLLRRARQEREKGE